MKENNNDFSKHGGKKDSHEHPQGSRDFKAHIKQTWSTCMNSLHKKLSCGSQQIATILKTRTHWGNRDRGHGRPRNPQGGNNP